MFGIVDTKLCKFDAWNDGIAFDDCTPGTCGKPLLNPEACGKPLLTPGACGKPLLAPGTCGKPLLKPLKNGEDWADENGDAMLFGEWLIENSVLKGELWNDDDDWGVKLCWAPNDDGNPWNGSFEDGKLNWPKVKWSVQMQTNNYNFLIKKL